MDMNEQKEYFMTTAMCAKQLGLDMGECSSDKRPLKIMATIMKSAHAECLFAEINIPHSKYLDNYSIEWYWLMKMDKLNEDIV